MKTTIRLCFALLLALIATPAFAAAQPNILFIMVDEMKWNVMSCAGHPIVKTPNLDRLASFRQQLTQRLPAAADNPAPQKTDAEAWKDKFFKQHPDADTNKDGVLSWPEYKAFKEKLDGEKKTGKPNKP